VQSLQQKKEKQEEGLLTKPVLKYLRKHFMITTKHGDSLCNKCRHKYYAQEQRQFSIQVRDPHIHVYTEK
jgi:hypothetical protein